jgi:hypothetical protein
MPNPTTDKAPQPDTNALIADALQKIATLQERQARQDQSFDDYLEKNPPKKLPFPLYLHDVKIDADSLTDADLELLPKLQEGRFFNGKIVVVRNHADGSWRIKWPRADMSERMTIAQYGRDFTEILQRITTEAPGKL